MSRVAALMLFFILSACTVHQNIGIGPLAQGNSPSTASMSCTENPGGRSCTVYFKDQTGLNVDSVAMVKKIDAHLSKVTPFDEWVSAAKNEKRARSFFPYKLYLLTMSPSIVMAVPVSLGTHDNCNGQYLKKGYLTSRLLMPVCYQYFDKPEVAKGSLWFSPEGKIDFEYIPDEADQYTINVNGVVVELAKSGSQWIVVRL